MNNPSINYWLQRMEVRQKSGEPYPPFSLYQLCCGLICALRVGDKPEVNVFTDPIFAPFKFTLDGQMKKLQSTGKYETRKVEIITEEIEDLF